MGTQPIPYAPSKIREFAEMHAQFDAIYRRLDEMQAQLDRATPLTAEAGVEYRYNYGDGIARPVEWQEAERLRAEGKGANLKTVPVQHMPPRPDLGPTRDVAFLGGS